MRTRILFLILLCSIQLQAAHAPSFPATLMDGSRTTLEEMLPKDKVMLISFWATWCVPCLQELSMLSTQMQSQKIPVKVITVNVDTSETKSQVRSTVERLKKDAGFAFDVVLDPTHAIFSKYQPTAALPFSVLVASDGSILESFSGYQQTMMSRIQTLAAAQSGPKKVSEN
jgi:thiol-disulfide isomerase/thioredoxin